MAHLLDICSSPLKPECEDNNSHHHGRQHHPGTHKPYDLPSTKTHRLYRLGDSWNIYTDDIHKPYNLPSTKTHRLYRLGDSWNIYTDDIHKPYDLPSTKTHRSCRLGDSWNIYRWYTQTLWSAQYQNAQILQTRWLLKYIQMIYTNPVICPVPKHRDPADSVTPEICTDDIHKPYDLPSTKTHRSCRLGDSWNMYRWYTQTLWSAQYQNAQILQTRWLLKYILMIDLLSLCKYMKHAIYVKLKCIDYSVNTQKLLSVQCQNAKDYSVNTQPAICTVLNAQN